MEQPLSELLRSGNPDTRQIIDRFIARFNAAHGSMVEGRWDISIGDWQRFEFLGDRVLNFVVARILFSRRDCVLDEGEMTKILSFAVSNQSLSALAARLDAAGFSRLVPAGIGENAYGERITAGAFEALIGALYCDAGFDAVASFIAAVMAESLDRYDPSGNAVGLLQEYYQKRGLPVPVYEHAGSSGPSHRPRHTYRVLTPDEKVFEGIGPNSSEAKQEAARAAFRQIHSGAG